MNEEPGETTYIGQPDIADFEASNGWHPRSRVGWNDPKIKIRQQLYETLLLHRNVELLRAAGFESVSILGWQYRNAGLAKGPLPVWSVVLQEFPQLDTQAPWEDVLAFRQEERTQHLARSMRRWVRKVVAEDWGEAELRDEIKELVYQYETHMRIGRLSNTSEALEIIITGAAELTEDLVKFRLGKIAKMVTAAINRRARYLRDESSAPGRELALMPETRRAFSQAA